MDRAERLERQGRWEEAIIEFKNAIRLDPHLPDAHAALGYHYQRKGLMAKAAEAFRMAAVLSDDYDSYFSWGHILIDLDRLTEAEYAINQCLKQRPGDPAARYELAYIRYNAGHYPQAVTELTSLLHDYPEDWELHFLRASCHLRLESWSLAEQDLRQATQNATDEETRIMLRENLDISLRHQEFPVGTALNTKDRLYADHGAICLGSSEDDGLQIPDYPDGVLSYAHIATTLRRFSTLYGKITREATVILPTETESLPLAMACSQILGLPLTSAQALYDTDVPLVITGICSGPELHDLVLEYSAIEPIHFAWSVNWARHAEFMADIVGVFSQKPCALPWQPDSDWWHQADISTTSRSAGKAVGRTLMPITRRIVKQYLRMPDQANWGDQVAYYRTHHRLLRPTLLPEQSHDRRTL
jgi:tetratricopeptide (TPR) repeat protein